MRILLVEDYEQLGDAVQQQIAGDGHAVDWMRSISDAESCLATTPYELVLLDLMLPDGRGIDLLKQLRRKGSSVPVIIITALDQISDRIAGLNAGADDYLIKPFDLSELSARVAAVGRRYAQNPNPLITLGDLTIDSANRSVARDGRTIDLTSREWTLFEALLRRPNRPLSKAALEESLYAFGDEIESNTIEVHISRLRKKIGKQAIQTVRGVGYRIGSVAAND